MSRWGWKSRRLVNWIELMCRWHFINLEFSYRYYLYKLPNSAEGNEIDSKNSGLNYLFITPDSAGQWTLSKVLIDNSSSMPGRTLSPIYKDDKDNNLVMMYNDEPTNGSPEESRGHTKGVVVANDISGFWLVHSVPKFPPALEEGGYDYPKSGKIYGQSFLCISFTGDEMGKIGKQLSFNEPQFYSSHVPNYLKTWVSQRVWMFSDFSFPSIYPELVAALKMTTITKAPYYSLETLYSRRGTKFLSFAKSQKFNEELYDDLVAPHFNAGWYCLSYKH